MVDTNTLVNAMLFPRSIPGQALDIILWDWRIVFSLQTFTEVLEVLYRKKFDRYVDQEDRKEFVSKVTRSAIWIEAAADVAACRDKKDDKFLSLAVAADAKLILTGDDDLLVLNPFQGIQILNPRDFLAT